MPNKYLLLLLFLITTCSMRDFNRVLGNIPNEPEAVSEIKLLCPETNTVYITDNVLIKAAITSVNDIDSITIKTPTSEEKTDILSSSYQTINYTFSLSNLNGYPNAKDEYPIVIEVKDVENNTIQSNFTLRLAVASIHAEVTPPRRPSDGSLWTGLISVIIDKTGAELSEITFLNISDNIDKSWSATPNKFIYELDIDVITTGSVISGETKKYAVKMKSVYNKIEIFEFTL